MQQNPFFVILHVLGLIAVIQLCHALFFFKKRLRVLEMGKVNIICATARRTQITYSASFASWCNRYKLCNSHQLNRDVIETSTVLAHVGKALVDGYFLFSCLLLAFGLQGFKVPNLVSQLYLNHYYCYILFKESLKWVGSLDPCCSAATLKQLYVADQNSTNYFPVQHGTGYQSPFAVYKWDCGTSKFLAIQSTE